MKVVKVKKVQEPSINCLEPEYLTRKTPPGMPPLNFMAVLYGAMGQGKTVALIKMLKMYDKTKSYDRLIWWSPTFGHEPKGKAFMEEKHNMELIHYEKFKESEFLMETQRMESDIEDYRAYLEKLNIWNKYVAHNRNLDVMTMEEIMWLDEMEFEKPTSPFKWGFPSFAIVFDDCVFEKGVFSANCKSATSNFFIAHRHRSCCVFLTSQVHANGIPRQIRGVIGVWVLFKCRSKELQEAIAKELSFKCDKDTILKVWDFATKKSHDFLFIDYKQNDLNDMFRVNFDNQIILDSGDLKNDDTEKN